jgi:hypothetical protein
VADAKGTQPNHYVTGTKNNTKVVNDNTKQPIPSSVVDKILANSKEKAKQELAKRKAPKDNWITRL